LLRKLDAAALDLPLAYKVLQQGAVTAAEVEDACARVIGRR
jgi:hypothetical protein